MACITGSRWTAVSAFNRISMEAGPLAVRLRRRLVVKKLAGTCRTEGEDRSMIHSARNQQ